MRALTSLGLAQGSTASLVHLWARSEGAVIDPQAQSEYLEDKCLPFVFLKHDFFCVCLILYLKPSPTDTVIGGCLIFLHITDELNNFPRLGIYSLYHFFHYYG